MKIITGLLLSLLWICAAAQQNPALRSRGPLPACITGTQDKQYNAEKQKRINRGDTLSPDQTAVIYNTSFFTWSIAQSGRLLVNDTMSSYANRIIDVLLKDDPKLRSEIQAYVYYSETDNVNTISNGMIIIEMGLFARLENEGQLAFILAHEISHYKYNHFLQSFQYGEKIKKETKTREASSLAYSRQLEYAADSIGFQIFSKAGYSHADVLSAFDVLHNSKKEPLQYEFDPTFFEHGRYEFPIEYYLPELVEVAKKDTAESESTHPATMKRKQVISNRTDSARFTDPHFLVSEPAFRFIKRLALEEYCNLMILNQDYGNAIYMGFALLKKDSTDLFARKIIGHALYNLTIGRLEPEPFETPKICIVHPDYNNDFYTPGEERSLKITEYNSVEGESQRMLYFLAALSKSEAAVLAFDWNWKTYSKYEVQDNVQNSICDNLLFILHEYYRFNEYKLTASTFPPLNDTAVADSAAQIAVKKSSPPKISPRDLRSSAKNPVFKSTSREEMYNDMKKADTRQYTSPAENLISDWNYMAFEKFYTDSVFADKLRKATRKDMPAEKTDSEILSRSQQQETSRYGPGINTVCLASANYLQYKEYKRTNTFDPDENKSYINQKTMPGIITATGKAKRVNVFVLSPDRMDSLSTNDYNTYCMLMQWLDERFNYNLNPFGMSLVHASLGDTLAERLGTPYIMLTTVTSKHLHRVRQPFLYLLAVIFPYSAPFAIIYGLIPNNRSQCQVSLVNVKTGKQEMYYEQHMKKKGGPGAMNVYYSKIFAKLARKPMQ